MTDAMCFYCNEGIDREDDSVNIEMHYSKESWKNHTKRHLFFHVDCFKYTAGADALNKIVYEIPLNKPGVSLAQRPGDPTYPFSNEVDDGHQHWFVQWSKPNSGICKKCGLIR